MGKQCKILSHGAQSWALVTMKDAEAMAHVLDADMVSSRQQ